MREPGRVAATTCRPQDPRGLTLMAVGDILMHTPLIHSASRPGGVYDFRPPFQYVRPLFRNADLVLGNLETPLAGGVSSGYPSFNAPDDLAPALRWAGFSALNLANNHALDRGWKGLYRTIEVLDANGFLYLGAFRSAEDRARPRLFSAGGVTVGLLGYTYGVNRGAPPYPGRETWRLNLAAPGLMAEDIPALKAAGADFVVVNLHFGEEYQRRPNARQLALVDGLFEAGADLVIGHHPHVVQPGLVRQGADGGRAAVFSLGNFISNQQDRYTDQGLIVTVDLGFDLKGRKTLGSLTLRQTRCLRRVVDGRPTYRILPVREAAADPAAYGLTRAEAAFLARDGAALSEYLVNYGS
jgi:poly-gamma-glutamate synthesis protein (capsule biosynthesis protein)